MKKTVPGLGLFFALLACQPAKKIAHSMLPTNFDKQGHRGCRGLMPENTIPAMKKAIDLGVTTLEMDAVISADRLVVVSHDVYFNENITTTPQGRYLTKAEAVKRTLYSMAYDSIRKYDVGLKPYPDFPRQEKLTAHKPLLSELIDTAEKYAALKGRPIAYNIEIKSKPENDGIRHPPVEEFVDLVLQVILSKGIMSRTIVQSFDPRALRITHKKYPAAVTALLIEANDKRTLEAQLDELGFLPSVYSPNFALVSPELVEQCHARNMRVIPWTVNTIEEIRKQKQMGVDGVISDYPDLFLQL